MGYTTAMQQKRKQERILGVVGVGLDRDDGHRRITTGDGFVMVGGSRETHERMQEFAVRVEEGAKKRGKAIPELSVPEAREIVERLR